MSIRRWLRSADNPLPLPRAGEDSSVTAANKQVAALVQGKKRVRGQYHHYDAELRAKIAKYACENGNKSTVDKFSAQLGYSLSEATVRNFKRTYLARLRAEGDADAITTLPHHALGRPLLIGEFDAQVYEYIKQLRAAGGIVNCNIVVAAAKGIVSHKRPSLLREYGGHIELGKKWAESFLQRRGFVKRKATKAARKLPPDFSELKAAYLRRIQDEVTAHDIPRDLLINWDQTGSKLVPVSQWTMAQEGSKQVPVVGKEDKREITVLLAVTASGTLLPPQLIYQGKTVGCHPRITFPPEWNVTHSDNHWSTEVTMIEYLEKVIIPYVVETRKGLDLPDDHPALAIFDVFSAHRCSSVLAKLQSNNIHQVFVPAGCTGELQPLDVGVNVDFKQLMKSHFSRWYAEEVRNAMDQGTALSDVKVDLRATVVKPLHANWIISTISTLSTRQESLKKPFETIGIVDTTCSSS